MDFKERIINTIKSNNLIESGDKVVLGVSGGPDSISMLNVLYSIKQEKHRAGRSAGPAHF